MDCAHITRARLPFFLHHPTTPSLGWIADPAQRFVALATVHCILSVSSSLRKRGSSPQRELKLLRIYFLLEHLASLAILAPEIRVSTRPGKRGSSWSSSDRPRLHRLCSRHNLVLQFPRGRTDCVPDTIRCSHFHVVAQGRRCECHQSRRRSEASRAPAVLTPDFGFGRFKVRKTLYQATWMYSCRSRT